MAKDMMQDKPESAAGDQLGAPSGDEGDDSKMLHIPVSLLPEGAKAGDEFRIASMDDDVATLEPFGKSDQSDNSEEDWAKGAKEAVDGKPGDMT